MDSNFINNLIIGSLRDPILWIIAIVFASNIISNVFKRKLFYLAIAGIIWGFIRLYVYKSFGEILTYNQTILLLLICLILMISLGSLLFYVFKLFKSNT